MTDSLINSHLTHLHLTSHISHKTKKPHGDMVRLAAITRRISSTTAAKNRTVSTARKVPSALYNLHCPIHRRHQLNVQLLQQQRSLSSLSYKIWDIIQSGTLNPSNPLVDDLYRNVHSNSPTIEDGGDGGGDNATSVRSLSLLFDYNKYQPHHFKEAATELQSIYDRELAQLEDEITNNDFGNDSINLIGNIDRISRPLITLQNIIVLLSSVKYNGNGSKSYQALADASSSIQLKHETSTVIYRALQKLQNENHGHRATKTDESNARKLEKCTQYLLQRHRINGTPTFLIEENNKHTSNGNSNDEKNHTTPKNTKEQLNDVKTKISKLESQFLVLSSYTMEQHGKSTPTQKILPFIYQIIALKQYYSALLGYDNYVQYCFDNHSSLVRDVDEIKSLHDSFVDELAIEKFGSREFMDKFLNVMSDEYLTSKQDDEEDGDISLKDYFELDNVLKELFSLCSLFSVEVIEEKAANLGWDKDVRLFHIYEKENTSDEEDIAGKKKIASFYLDPFRRLNKDMGEFMVPIVHKSTFIGNAIVHTIPIAAISLDVRTPPWDDLPVQLEFDDVAHLFHEFGHLLQFVLADVDAGAFSGAPTIEEDASEVVSQVCE